MKILTMILAGGTDTGLSVLTRHRAKTALPFGGRYRIIDFCLSNCVHSGLHEIYVLAQFNPKSLIEHIRMGKPWDLDRKSGGVFILQPRHYGQEASWYLGTADALYQNLDVIRRSEAEHVLVLSGDQVYRADYGDMVAFHLAHGKPVTIACKKVPPSQQSRFGMVRCLRDGAVREFREKPRRSRFDRASLGIYLFRRRFLVDALSKPRRDIVFDLLMPLIDDGKVFGFSFDGYWDDLGTVMSYYAASMRLIRSRSLIARRDWPVFTRADDLPPSMFLEGSRVERSIVADGCRIGGTVSGSILFPGVVVERGAVVEDSIIFSHAEVGADTRIERAVIDKQVVIGSKAAIGASRDTPVGIERHADMDPGLDTGGITVIGKLARIADGLTVPRGFAIEPGAILA